MPLTTFQTPLSTTTIQLATADSGRRALYLENIGTLTAWLSASSTGTSTNAFPVKAADPVFRLDGAAASDAIWGISTAAAGAVLAGYRR